MLCRRFHSLQGEIIREFNFESLIRSLYFTAVCILLHVFNFMTLATMPHSVELTAELQFRQVMKSVLILSLEKANISYN